MQEEIKLSQWWKTPSAQASFERVKQAKRDRLNAMKQQCRDKKAKLLQEAEEWEQV